MADIGGDPATEIELFGSNTWILEDMRERFELAPDSVSERWRAYFEGRPIPPPDPDTSLNDPLHPPVRLGVADAIAATQDAAAGNGGAAAPPKPPPTAEPAEQATAPDEGVEMLRGASATIADRMEASKDLPTATSVRTFPAKLLEVNRKILNNQLIRTAAGGKVSFTHLIGWAVVHALMEYPAMNAAYREVDGKPAKVAYEHINLGLAMDMPKKGGGRTLLVPNIKAVDTMDFYQYWFAYEDIVARARSGKITPDDFAGTTATLTNPGTVGTVQSVPRLMPDQGVIVGVGRIGYPPEYEGADPATIAGAGIGRTLTMTSTYDHRIIQGAESGMFLARIHQLLLGADRFYDDIFRSMRVPYVPAQWAVDTNPPPGTEEWAEKQARVFDMISNYRTRGHLIADLDPLRQDPPEIHPELDPLTYGLTIWDLDREFGTGGLGGRTRMKLGELLGVLRDAYCRTVGIEYMHIQEPDQKLWIQQHVETPTPQPSNAEKRRIMQKLIAAQDFERYLHTKFLGAKRFSLEGSESLIPCLDTLLNTASDAGMEEIVLGMAHRGRLNVLANIVHKPLEHIFHEFHGPEDEYDDGFSGDVKYHLGARGLHVTPAGRSIAVDVAANPSHLEAVDPVLVGIARAKQDRMGPGSREMILPVLIHGDAAFSGQGVVAETLNLSQLPGYTTGGTVHVVVNNQVGFTTSAADARSSHYATDVAKTVQAPIIHVNADDPEAVVRVTRLAFNFREAFQKDVVIDLICYRRLGHNEGDEPTYTQPKMYRIIEDHPTVRERYADHLLRTGAITEEELDELEEEYRSRLDAGLELSRTLQAVPHVERTSSVNDIDTSLAPKTIELIATQLTTLPSGFTLHPKLARQLQQREQLYAEGLADWALAEAYAFGSLSLEGRWVRLAGEDSRRGTFSHRHAVLVDYVTEEDFMPLQHLGPRQAPLRIFDSLLSEFAALGFEYGYSVGAPEALVMWEAQFGDFVNGAQVVIDQFLASGMDKWDQTSGIVLLLPHGFEGQGPEHSSARLERFLTNAAEDNMRVIVPSTPASYFHALRTQALHPEQRPLIVMAPKSLLRTRETYSPVEELTEGGFRAVIPDVGVASPRRIILCSGKIYYDLKRYRSERGIDDVALVRVERLYPFPAEQIRQVLDSAGDAEVVWVQEEPANMGAWRFMSRYLFVEAGSSSRGIYRKESASPATGNPKTHVKEQNRLLEKAFAPAD